MGASYTTYIGPFLRCKYNRVEQDRRFRGCVPCNKKMEGGANFCPRCGGKITYDLTERVTVDDIPDYSALAGEDVFVYYGKDEKLNEMYLVPNRTNLLKRPCFLSHRETAGIFLTQNGFNVEAEIATLKVEYADKISALIKGFANVSVEWGVVTNVN